MDLIELKQYILDRIEPSYNDYNQYKISTLSLKYTECDIKLFNEIYTACCSCSELYDIIRTKSNSIKQPSVCYTNATAYDVKVGNSIIRLTVLIGECAWCLKVGGKTEDNEAIPGSRAFKKFKDLCSKYKINLDDYEIDNGEEVKKEIEKPLIYFKDEYKYCVTENVHHLDFHSSYPAGLAITHREFIPVIQELYDGRKKKPTYKAILNETIGYMQSKSCCGAKWAHLSRDAIKNNNDRIRALTKELEEHGYVILGYNTDGIWYQGKRPYRNEMCGSELGKWSNDYVNCKFRAKSDGAYEFIDKDGYHAVVRGSTKLDRVKDRSEWQWGDIFQDNAEVIEYVFDKTKGIIEK